MPYGSASHPLASLRARLTLWNAAVVVFVVVIALWAVREGLRWTLVAETEELLLQDAAEIALAVESCYPDLERLHGDLDRKAIGHSPRRMFVELLDAEGHSLWSSIHTPELLDLPPPRQAAGPLLAADPFRVAQRYVDLGQRGGCWVRVGMSLEFVQADVAKLTRLSLIVGGLVLALAPLGGYLLSGRATKPLSDLIRTAARLRPSNLTERLPLRGSGDELDRLSATINGLLDRIALYLERHREFLANAAHELRSPLAAVHSSVEVALNTPRSTEEYQELLESIIDECGQLSTLVNQLLLLAENDAGFLEVQHRPVELGSILERAVDMFKGAAEERQVELTLHFDSRAIVSGDGPKLRQVIHNLIDNSLKFTPPGGRVQVALERDEAAGVALLRVADSGIGIAEHELPRIFERFYRVDKSRDRDDRRAGNGLGLSICAAIVEAHGGRIEATSRIGQGTTFLVRLPLDAHGGATGRPLVTHSAGASTSSH